MNTLLRIIAYTYVLYELLDINLGSFLSSFIFTFQPQTTVLKVYSILPYTLIYVYVQIVLPV